uniref:Uncharacterized protein n=1 Tax=Janibacter limosus TaxID=53458 RepID=A0AC61U8Z7_9MICO|nr:hypothetical protein [Janibacter limosus]
MPTTGMPAATTGPRGAGGVVERRPRRVELPGGDEGQAAAQRLRRDEGGEPRLAQQRHGGPPHLRREVVGEGVDEERDRVVGARRLRGRRRSSLRLAPTSGRSCAQSWGCCGGGRRRRRAG